MNINTYARRYQTSDEEKIVDLLKSSFPDWAKRSNPLAYWRWKYLDTPLSSAISIVVSGERVIGIWHEISFNIKFGSEVVLSHMGDDTATHQDFRGAGVYNKLDDLNKKWHAEARLKYLHVITTNPIIVKWESKRGIQEFPHRISHMIRVKDVSLHMKVKSVENAWIVGFGFSVLKTLNMVINGLIPTVKRESDFRISDISSFDDGIDVFWSKVKDSYSYILERKMDHLNWRYCDPRGGAFHVKQAVKDGEILGFIATEVREGEGYSEGYILDLLALPSRSDVADALLKEACKYFDGLGVNAVHYQVVKGHPYQLLSTKSNFIDTLRTIDMHIFTTFTDADRERDTLMASLPGKVYFNYGDYL